MPLVKKGFKKKKEARRDCKPALFTLVERRKGNVHLVLTFQVLILPQYLPTQALPCVVLLRCHPAQPTS